MSNIGTGTDVRPVAVSQDGTRIFNKQDTFDPKYREKLGTFVDEAPVFVDNNNLSLDAAVVNDGPGSYTGLRAGVSMAEGIYYGRRVRLLVVPTSELLVVPVLLHHEEAGENIFLIPMADACRMEVYSTVYDRALKEVCDIQADVVDENTYRKYPDHGPVYFFGNGAEKCMKIISHPNAHLTEGVDALAKNMFSLTKKCVVQEKFRNVTYLVSFYLKDSVAKQMKPLL